MKRKNTGSIVAGLLALQFVMQAAGVQVTAFAEDAVLPEEPAAATAVETTAPAATTEVTVAATEAATQAPTEAATEATTEAATEATTVAATQAATEVVAEAAETTVPATTENVTISDDAAPAAEAVNGIYINNPGQIPSEIKSGTAVTVSGTVTSNNGKTITKVRAEILNKAGTVMSYGEATPGTTTYDLKNLDSKIRFDTLAVGDYVYHVTATNSANITTNMNVNFKVVSGTVQDALTLTGTLTNIPSNIKKGTAITVSGVVKSASSNLTSVSIKITDQSGTTYFPNKLVPNKTTYDLSAQDNFIKFDTLPEGTYTYRVVASNATHTDVILQEQTFTVGSGTPIVQDNLTLTGATALPDSMIAGSDYAIKGSLTSITSNIKSLFVGVYNSAGQVVTGRTIAPNTLTYDLKNMDDYVAFNGLTAGNYLFAVIASNSAKTNEVLLTKNFTVTGTAPVVTSDNITLTGATEVPNSIKYGTSLNIQGNVESESSNLKTLTVAVYDLSGNFKTGGTINPASKKSDLYYLDRYLSFQTLAAGSYHYYVMASNDKNTNKVLAHKQFTVEASTAVPDTMTLTGFTSLPASITQNSVQNIKGTVTSGSSNLTTLFAGVYNSLGQVVTGRTIAPGATSCDLAAKLNPYIEFNKLTPGEYTFAIIASNATTTNQVLANQKIKVVAAATNSLSITNSTVIPAAFKKGDTLKITGVVTSDSVMSSLFVGIYNSTGQVMSGRTVIPNATTYDVKNLDSYVKFNELQPGTYTYAVIATNATNTNYPVIKQSFTVGNADADADKLTLTNPSTVPDQIPVGKAVSVYGTVTSASSNITSVTVGIYKGTEFISGRTINPNAKTYNLANLDSFVKFNELKDGEYTYAVIVSNATHINENLLVKKFTVGKGNVADSITISNGTSVPSALTKGSAVSVKGTITSSANLTSVTVGIYDVNGTAVYAKTVAPNAKSYTISKEIDNALLFNRLSAGTYTYRVIASTANTSNYTVTNQSFTVK